MLPAKLPRATGSDPIVMAPWIYNAILDELIRLGKFVVIPPLTLSDDDTGRTLGVRPGGGPADESAGEFQWQLKIMGSANQPTWDDDRWTGALEDVS